MQYQIVSVDMPGYGKSAGKAHSFRTIHILDKDGPAELIRELVKILNLQNVTLVGYDWGGSIALRLGVQNSADFENIIAFMPAYGESDQNRDELKKLKTKTFIHWVKQDMMHVWSKFKEKALKIPNVNIELTDVKLWKSEIANNLYEKISDQILGPQCKFLTGIDPF